MAARLFRHGPTNKWLPVLQGAQDATPGVAYLPRFAVDFGIQPADIQVIEPVDTLPADFESNRLMPVATPLTPQQAEEADAQAHALPTPAQIEAAVAALSSLADVKVFLARLAKIVRILAVRQGLG